MWRELISHTLRVESQFTVNDLAFGGSGGVKRANISLNETTPLARRRFVLRGECTDKLVSWLRA